MKRRVWIGIAGAVVATATVFAIVLGVGQSGAQSDPAPVRPATPYLANDSHLHLTNYVQEGPSLPSVIELMGDKIGRAALFGIPLQQMWSYRLSRLDAPTYYLDTDAPLYYYSFTDAFIAMAYKRLPPAQQARIDPMITGFNPADMYAADHVRRVLQTFPGVFVGIGEFSIHKEFVTSKIAGDGPSITDPALGRLFDFAAETGLIVLVHCDADVPFPKPNQPPEYLEPLLALFRAHPNTTFIWAHVGLGRVIRPFTDMRTRIAEVLEDPTLSHVNFDLSWSETAKYLLQRPDSPDAVAAIITRHPTRFLFGTDEVGPTKQDQYLRVLRMYDPLWERLSPAVADQVRKGNYERLFDAARTKVRAWEAKNLP